MRHGELDRFDAAEIGLALLPVKPRLAGRRLPQRCTQASDQRTDQIDGGHPCRFCQLDELAAQFVVYKGVDKDAAARAGLVHRPLDIFRPAHVWHEDHLDVGRWKLRHTWRASTVRASCSPLVPTPPETT